MSSVATVSHAFAPPAKKRVFISSTSQDLQKERLSLKAALPQMCDVEFSGMEDWGARADSPVKVSLDETGRSDLYVGIIGNRYGYVDPSSGQSVTEMEYRHAKSQGKQCLMYFLKPEIPSGDTRFEAFKAELKRNNVVGWFETPEQLSTRVIIDVHNTLNDKAKAADATAALMAAIFDGRSLRKIFERLGVSGMYVESEGVAENTNSLLAYVQGSSKTEDLFQALRAVRPEINWQAGAKPARRWIPAAISGAVAITAAVILTIAYLPRPVTSIWEDEFKVADTNWAGAPERTQWEGSSMWNAPPDWRVVKGKHLAPDDGALLVKGTQMGTRAGLGWHAYSDFDAEFEVHFVRGERAAWVFRAQKDGASGYVFELVNKNSSLYLQAHILKNRVLRPFPNAETLVDIGPCCEKEDRFVVDTEALRNQFKFAVTLLRKTTGDPGAAGVKIPVGAFTDDAATFKHGNVGLLQLGAQTESQYERWCVSPLPVPANSHSCIPPVQ